MPQVELLGLISTGNTSEPVHAYFTQYLTEQVNICHFYSNTSIQFKYHGLMCIYVYHFGLLAG